MTTVPEVGLVSRLVHFRFTPKVASVTPRDTVLFVEPVRILEFDSKDGVGPSVKL